MSYSPKDLIRLLLAHGFILSRTKGSHQIFHNPNTNKTVVVPVHGNRDMPKGTYYAILKQAGIV